MTDSPTPIHHRLRRFGRPAAIGAALLAIGGLGGAAVIAETRPSVTMAPAMPVAIRSLTSDGIVTVRGRVAEVYGNKFVVEDASGRALIDTGPDGDDDAPVTTGQTVTVQGRFDDGFVHAAFLVAANGKVVALGPVGGKPHGRHGPDGGPDRSPHGGPGRDGPRGGPDGPDRGPGAPPPPPVAGGTTPTAPVVAPAAPVAG